MTPAEKLRELRQTPGTARYYRLHVGPDYGGATEYLLVQPERTRPLSEREALLYVANWMKALEVPV